MQFLREVYLKQLRGGDVLRECIQLWRAGGNAMLTGDEELAQKDFGNIFSAQCERDLLSPVR